MDKSEEAALHRAAQNIAVAMADELDRAHRIARWGRSIILMIAGVCLMLPSPVGAESWPWGVCLILMGIGFAAPEKWSRSVEIEVTSTDLRVADRAGRVLTYTDDEGDTRPVLLDQQLTNSHGDVFRVEAVDEGGVLSGTWTRYNGRADSVPGRVAMDSAWEFPGVMWTTPDPRSAGYVPPVRTESGRPAPALVEPGQRPTVTLGSDEAAQLERELLGDRYDFSSRSAFAVRWTGENKDEVKAFFARHVDLFGEDCGPYFSRDDEPKDKYNTVQFEAWGDDQEVDPGKWIVAFPEAPGYGEIVSDEVFQSAIGAKGWRR